MSKPLLTELGIQHRLESCAMLYAVAPSQSRAINLLISENSTYLKKCSIDHTLGFPASSTPYRTWACIFGTLPSCPGTTSPYLLSQWSSVWCSTCWDWRLMSFHLGHKSPPSPVVHSISSTPLLPLFSSPRLPSDPVPCRESSQKLPCLPFFKVGNGIS